MNRTLVEMAHCILLHAKLSISFWAEAVHTAGYLRNRCASSSLDGDSPYRRWKGRVPQLGHLRTIGTEGVRKRKI
ncbi:Copia protein [Ooceraea biroi]|uniref:Copia protein n=1 Tax=Ooceraea biroi TaxID=2015173 RepID=A0A026WUF1_OOCBI|nr:Copia protein [Ooceraea biroi]